MLEGDPLRGGFALKIINLAMITGENKTWHIYTLLDVEVFGF
jgi:hypothetical protein